MVCKHDTATKAERKDLKERVALRDMGAPKGVGVVARRDLAKGEFVGVLPGRVLCEEHQIQIGVFTGKYAMATHVRGGARGSPSGSARQTVPELYGALHERAGTARATECGLGLQRRLRPGAGRVLHGGPGEGWKCTTATRMTGRTKCLQRSRRKESKSGSTLMWLEGSLDQSSASWGLKEVNRMLNEDSVGCRRH